MALPTRAAAATWTEDSGEGGGGNGITARGGGWLEGKEIGEDSNEIKSDEDQRSEEKGTRKIFLGFDDFAGAVGAELPAFVSPENGDHAQAEVGKEREAALGGTESGQQVGGVASEREQYGAENNDDPDFQKRGPILKIGALARAPDVDEGDDSDHGDRDYGGTCSGERDYFGEVARKGTTEGGNRGARDDKEKAPTIEERGNAAKSVANVTVEAAGFRIGGGEFGVGERTEKREDAANEPDEK